MAADIDAEAAVVAGVMIDPQRAADVAALLGPDDFDCVNYRLTWPAVLELAGAVAPGDGISALALADRLRVRGDFEKVGGHEFVAWMLDAGAPHDVMASARIVRELAERRRALAFTDRLATTIANRSIPVDEILAEASSQLAERARTASKSSQRAFLTDEDVEKIPDPQFTVGDFVPMAGTAEIHGPPGCGKTFFAIAMACDVAIGHAFLGRPVVRGRVIYVTGEGRASLGTRVRAWRAERAYSGSLDVRWKTEPVHLLERSSVVRFIAEVQREFPGPVLIIFDTLARCMVGGDENSAKDMGIAMDALDRIRRETGAAVLPLHHARHDGEKERGSTALRGAVDTMISIKSDGATLKIACEKQKDAPPFATFEATLKPVETSRVITTKHAWESDARIPTETHRKMAVTLSDFQHAGGATATKWLAAGKVPQTSFYRYVKQLLEWGYVALDKAGAGGRYTLTPRGESLVTTALPNNYQLPVGSTRMLTTNQPPSLRGVVVNR